MASAVIDRATGVALTSAMKAPCRVAATGNITLSGLQTVDDVALAAGDRVLVAFQTSSPQNGVWIVDTGAWTRAPDFDSVRDVVQGVRVWVNGGTTYAGTEWQISSTDPVPGTSAITFTISLAKASEADARGGTNDTRFMTPAGVRAAIEEFAAITTSTTPVAVGLTDDQFETTLFLSGGEYMVDPLAWTQAYFINTTSAVTLDFAWVQLGCEFRVYVQSTAGSSCKIRINEDQIFIGQASTTNAITLSNGQFAKVCRIRDGSFSIVIEPIMGSARYWSSGTKYAERRADGLWTLSGTQAVNNSSNTTINLPVNFSGLSATNIRVYANVTVDTTYAQPYALVCEVSDDTSFVIHNSNTSSELGSNTQVRWVVDGVENSLDYAGTETPSTAVVPAKTISVIGAGQSLGKLASQGGYQGLRAGLAALGSGSTCWFIMTAAGGSALLRTACSEAFPDNYWWDYAAHSPGPLATACRDAILARPAAQPLPSILYWNQGQEEYIAMGNTAGVTTANYAAAHVELFAWLRTAVTAPNLKIIIEPLVNRRVSSNAGAGSAVRLGQLAACVTDTKCFMGAENYDSVLKTDGLHWDLASRNRAMKRQASAVYNALGYGTAPLGPTITGFSAVTTTRFKVDITASSGSLSKPTPPGGFAILPAGTEVVGVSPLTITNMTWSGNSVLVDVAEPTTGARLVYPWDCLEGVSSTSFITDSSGLLLRSSPVLTAS